MNDEDLKPFDLDFVVKHTEQSVNRAFDKSMRYVHGRLEDRVDKHLEIRRAQDFLQKWKNLNADFLAGNQGVFEKNDNE